MQWTWAHPLREPRVRATTSFAATLQRHPDTSVADIPSADKQQPIPHFGLQAANHSTHPVAYRTQGLPRLLASKQQARTHPVLTGNTPYQLLGLQAASLLTHALPVHNKPPQFTSRSHLLFGQLAANPNTLLLTSNMPYHSPGLQAASLSTQSFLAHNTARLQRLLRGFVCVDHLRTWV